MRSRRQTFPLFGWLLAGAVILSRPAPAAAHLVTTGMGPVYDGIGHLLMTPEDQAAALAIALYAGMRGAAAGRRALFLLPAAWLAGGIAGLTAGAVPSLPVQAASLLVVGSIVAADLHMPANAVSMLSIVVGLSHGFFNGAVLQEGPGVSGLIGIAIMLFVLLALTSAFVVTRKQPWTRIAVRVAGSWIVATGLLMVGWVIRGTS